MPASVFLIIIVFFISVSCEIIDFAPVKTLRLSDNPDSYFGYSLLLQKGNPSIVIVGAPNKRSNNKTTGGIYKCDLTKNSCQEYIIPSNVGIFVSGRNGHFLGGSLDGEDVAGKNFFTCASRFTTPFDVNSYFSYGKCFNVKNSSELNGTVDIIEPAKDDKPYSSYHRSYPYYNSAFAEYGFDLKYLKNNNELILGAPGRALFSGAAISVSLARSSLRFYDTEILDPRTDIKRYQYNYLGYSVSFGRFIKNSKDIWYLAGAPRANLLKGEVIFFKKEKSTITEKLLGEEHGSFFGASLLVINYSDKGDDVLVGAPTSAGNSWDEGCVYYYKSKNNGKFYAPFKLYGKQTGSRFGQVLADLGDINLDGFADVAISAPYEDDGTGAVYLYYGTRKGFDSLDFQRITPSNAGHNPTNDRIQGFGLGISRGNDVDGNIHNDFAVGAFKSNAVFAFFPKSIVDVTTIITPVTQILYTSTSNFSVRYCLMTYRRNKLKILSNVAYQLKIQDERVLSNPLIVTRVANLLNDEVRCHDQVISLKNNFISTSPFVITLNYQNLEAKNTTDNFCSSKSIEIPVSHGCGEDNICNTDISLEAFPDKDHILLGKHNEMKIKIIIRNKGEFAYRTKLYIKLPPDVTLINIRECTSENEHYYVCLVAEQLVSETESNFLIDIGGLQMKTQLLQINFTVVSYGIEKNTSDNQITVSIPVVRESVTYLYNESVPENIVWNKLNDTTTFSQIFGVVNQGPSPLNVNLTVLVARVDHEVFELEVAEVTVNDITSECVVNNYPLEEEIKDWTSILDCPGPNSSCSTNNFTKVTCQVGYVFKSRGDAVCSLKFLVHLNRLAMLQNQDTFTFSSMAFLNNGSITIFGKSSTFIYGLSEKTVIPLWIYVASVTAGFILLGLLTFLLYKCNFFKRSYKDRQMQMEQEESRVNFASASDDEETSIEE